VSDRIDEETLDSKRATNLEKGLKDMRRSLSGIPNATGAEKYHCCEHNAYGAWDSYMLVQDLRPKIVIRPDNAINLLT